MINDKNVRNHRWNYLTKSLTAVLLFTDLTLEGFASFCIPLEPSLKLESSKVADLGWTKDAFGVLSSHNEMTNFGSKGNKIKLAECITCRGQRRGK